ncbi:MULTISPECIES: hypothetical protein [Streptomyces violaceusniger group]|uniref:hypothetical protein n=1 Tax=Streptomyces violaceusniger group TaxID=2839105 RepID=UPI000A39A5C7|nr:MULTISPECIES: hypothetical protein [Streptomyces violaceusniger group]
MVALRSRRLEGLFGARLDAVSHAQVAAPKTNAVCESYDLEFKGELHGGNDRARRDLAGDVAALARTAYEYQCRWRLERWMDEWR